MLRNLVRVACCILLSVIFSIFFINLFLPSASVSFEVSSHQNTPLTCQLYYATHFNSQFSESRSRSETQVLSENIYSIYEIKLPVSFLDPITQIRLDFESSSNDQKIYIKSLKIDEKLLNNGVLVKSKFKDIKVTELAEDVILLETRGNDPYIIINQKFSLFPNFYFLMLWIGTLSFSFLYFFSKLSVRPKNCSLNLTKADTAFLKGIAIVCVVSHNYFHLVSPILGENEMYFNQLHYQNLILEFLEHPAALIKLLFSFFGHYGVHIFIFLSGYGLTKKTLNSEQIKNCSISLLFRVSIHQILKIIKLTFVGLFVVSMYYYLTGSEAFSLRILRDYFVFLTFTENIRPHGLYCFISSWWFLALIVQCYLLFPFLFVVLKKQPQITLLMLFLMLCFAGCSWRYFLEMGISIFSTPVAHAFIFALGMYFAFGFSLSIQKLSIFIPFIPLTFVSEVLFPFSFSLITLGCIFLYAEKFSQRNSIVRSVLIWIGGVSMFMYIIHSEFRSSILPAVNQFDTLFLTYICYLGYLTMVIFLGYICKIFSKKFL